MLNRLYVGSPYAPGFHLPGVKKGTKPISLSAGQLFESSVKKIPAKNKIIARPQIKNITFITFSDRENKFILLQQAG